MKIGFDGKRALQNFTGLGNYSRFVLNLLSQKSPENEYHVFSPKRPKERPALDANIIHHYPSQFTLKSYWRSFGIVNDLKKFRLDLYHGLSNELPFRIAQSGIPSVVTIHDLIFLRFPDYYPPIDRKIYRYKFEYACKNASRIIAVSKQTKQDIMTFFHIPESKIDVVYQGCNQLFQHSFSEIEIAQVKQEYRLPEKFILNVGTIEERKNLLLIVKALASVQKDVKLVVIGKETEYSREVKEYIAANNLFDRVVFLKNVPLRDLPLIYRCAEIFVYPSRFEGFGIPVIEALYSGVPVIAATGSCLEEAGGPLSCYVHPQDEVQLAWHINAILSNADKKQKMIAEGFRYVQKFSEEKLATDLITTYQKALNNA